MTHISHAAAAPGGDSRRRLCVYEFGEGCNVVLSTWVYSLDLH